MTMNKVLHPRNVVWRIYMKRKEQRGSENCVKFAVKALEDFTGQSNGISHVKSQ